jgi:hypothetical protein
MRVRVFDNQDYHTSRTRMNTMCHQLNNVQIKTINMSCTVKLYNWLI